MTLETDVAALTSATTQLLNTVNVSKATLDEKVASASTSAATATAKAAEAVSKSDQALAVYGTAAGLNAAQQIMLNQVNTAANQAALAIQAAAASSSLAQQDLSGAQAAALHRSPNAIVQAIVIDTSKDSDGGAWPDKCGHLSYSNEALYGAWVRPLGTAGITGEFQARGAGGTLGAEKIVNGNFDAGTTTWTVGAGATVSTVDGALRVTSTGVTNRVVRQALSVTIGVPLMVSFRSNVASGTARIRMTNSALMDSPAADYFDHIPAAGALAAAFYVVVPTAATIYFSVLPPTDGTYCSVDDVSVKEVTALAPSGSFYPNATDGKFYRLWKNFYSYASEFDNAVWSKARCTIAPNAASTWDGVAIADGIVEDNTSNSHPVYRPFSGAVAGMPYTASVEVKAGSRTVFNLTMTDTAFPTQYSAMFDLSAVTATTVAGSQAGTPTITALGGGWFRCTITSVPTVNGGTISVYNQPVVGASTVYLGNGSTAVYVARSQLQIGAAFDGFEDRGSEAGSQTEVFRGNSAKFPRLAAAVAEAARVVIYDLTQPGRPMWMVFARGGTGAANVTMLGIETATMGSLSYKDGKLTIAHNNGGGVYQVDFSKDKRPRWNSVDVSEFNGTIAQRNQLLGHTSVATTPIASGTVNAVAMTTLPDAPVDPVTGLQVPTIAAGTSAGVSVIKHDGSVVNSSYNTAAHYVALTPTSLIFGNSSVAAYNLATGAPGQLGAAFSSIQYYATNSSGAGFINPALAVQDIRFAGRGMFAGRQSGPSFAFSLMRFNESNPAASQSAVIGGTYNAGYMVGDIRRAWLSDVSVGAVSDVNLVTDGGFDTPSAWSATGTASVGSGVGTVPASSALRQVIATAPGSTYEATWTVNTASNKGLIQFGTTLGSADVLSPGSYFTTTGPQSIRFTAKTTSTAVQLYNDVSPSATWVVDGLSIREVVADRSYKAKPIGVNGTLTKTAVAAAAQLVAFGNFSNVNYLQEAYSADLDPATGGFLAGAWMSMPTGTLPAASFPDTGAERLGNWDFSGGGTSWAVTGNDATHLATFSGGTLRYQSDTTTPALMVQQGGVATPGQWYSITMVVTGWVSGQLKSDHFLDANGLAVVFPITAPGTYRVVGKCASGGGSLTFTRNSPNVDVTIDSISLKVVSPAIALDRSGPSGSYYRFGCWPDGVLVGEVNDGATTRTVTSMANCNTGTFAQVYLSYATSGALTLWVNGQQVAQTTGVPLLTLSNANALFTVGNSRLLNAAFPGTLTLVKVGMTQASADTMAWIYEQEKQMVRDGAQVTLPDAGALVDLSYDESQDKWVVASAANESSFTGLVRTSVVPAPAGSYSKVGARSGAKLTARSGTNPGVDVTVSAQNLKEELVRADKAARAVREWTFLDYVGGFTGTTNNANTVIASTNGIVIPVGGTVNGALVSGAGIPAGASISSYIVGQNAFLSANATSTNVTTPIAFFDFILPLGYTAKVVLVEGIAKQEGANKHYTRVWDGFRERIRFNAGAQPGATAWVQIQAVKVTA